MSQQYPSTWKQCATCTYWLGKRECDCFGQRVTVSSPMEKGKCAIPRGSFKGADRQANGSCVDFEKWPVLK